MKYGSAFTVTVLLAIVVIAFLAFVYAPVDQTTVVYVEQGDWWGPWWGPWWINGGSGGWWPHRRHRLGPGSEHRLGPGGEHRLGPGSEHRLGPGSAHRLGPGSDPEHRLGPGSDPAHRLGPGGMRVRGSGVMR